MCMPVMPGRPGAGARRVQRSPAWVRPGSGAASAPAWPSRSAPRRPSASRSSSPSTGRAVDGRVRTAATMGQVACWHFAGVAVQGGFPPAQRPRAGGASPGLTLLYGTSFTIMFTVLPRRAGRDGGQLGDHERRAIFALVLDLGRCSIRPSRPRRCPGGLIVVGTVMWLGCAGAEGPPAPQNRRHGRDARPNANHPAAPGALPRKGARRLTSGPGARRKTAQRRLRNGSARIAQEPRAGTLAAALAAVHAALLSLNFGGDVRGCRTCSSLEGRRIEGPSCIVLTRRPGASRPAVLSAPRSKHHEIEPGSGRRR